MPAPVRSPAGRDRHLGLLTLLLTGLALLAGAAGLAHAETLSEALARGYASNPQLLGERAQLRATDETVPQALANWRPTVSVNADQGIVHNASRQDCGKAAPSLFGGVDCSSHALNTFQNLWPQSYGLTIDQPLYRGGRTVAETEQALATVRAERAHLSSVEQTVFLTIVTDYMNVVLAQASLDLATGYEHSLGDEVAAARRRLAGGEVTLTDLSETEAFHAQALASLRSGEIQLETARAAYERDVGASPGRAVAPEAMPELPLSLGDAVEVAATANPDVVSALLSQQAAESNVRAVFGQRLPTLSLQATIQRSKETASPGLRTDTGQVFAQLSAPIYEAGAIASQVRAADQQVAVQRQQVDAARRSATEAARQAFAEVAGAAGVIDALRLQVRSYAKSVDGVRHEATVGDRSVFDILYQEQGEYQSRLSLEQALHDQTIARFTLAQALGRLTARNLGLDVEYYDPDEHFSDVRDANGLP